MNFLLLIADKPWFRSFGKFLNRIVKFNSPIAVQIGDLTLYAKTLDRLVALFLIKIKMNEAFESSFLKTLIKPGMVVADIGANLGRYTLIMSKEVGLSGEVHAFEPDKENFYLLKCAVENGKYNNVIIYNKAVSSESGKGTLFFCEEHRGNHSIFDDSAGKKKIEIETVALDNLFLSGKRIDLIKMDIEGAEAAAQKGMIRILDENPHIKIISEFWPFRLRKSGNNPKEFLESWVGLGFEIYLINEKLKKIEKTSIEKLTSQITGIKYCNIFLSKKFNQV